MLEAVLKVLKLAESRMAAVMLFQMVGAEMMMESEEARGRCRTIVAPERNALCS